MTPKIKGYVDRILQTCKGAAVPDAIGKCIASQAKLETGNFTSTVFVDDNNCFGMKVPRKRKSPYISGTSLEGNIRNGAPKSEGETPYARYKCIEDSVRDLLHWLAYNKCDFTKITNAAQYVAFLNGKGYFGISETAYLKQLNGHLKEIA